ncbi:sigma-54 factor interaction domain-containing protein, partial [Salmonella enterica subsp. enterica serovar Istanbul]|nr:sigma-54 factor interaction domain-containing protein [Salmonella enterica subsp. enterica serovar Istanbul]
SELFGHERGAFTGAIGQRKGLFEQAHGGTLFIDEIGDLDLMLQPKLLRAVERGEIRRVGGDRWTRIDLR